MHKLVAVTLGLFLALSTVLTSTAEAGDRHGYYCPPTYAPRPIYQPRYEPAWYRSRETGGYYKWNDYHQDRGQSWGENPGVREATNPTKDTDTFTTITVKSIS